MPKLAAVILAAGQGTRMKSRIPKILHEVGGLPMVTHVFQAASSVATLPPVIVVSPGDDSLQEIFADGAVFVEQPEQLGTGHAARMAESVLRGKTAQVLVVYADMPLLRSETMESLAVLQATTGAAVSMLVTTGDPGSTFGRVLRANSGRVHEIVEVAEARQRTDGDQIVAVTELNVGVYCFASSWLWENLPKLPLRQARSGQEYYLTDMVELAVKQGLGVEAMMLQDPDEALGAGTRAELIVVDRAFRRRVNNFWLAHGVTIVDPDTTYIDQPAKIGQDTIIKPNTHIRGASTIGRNCQIGPNSIIRNSLIGDNCTVESTVVENFNLDDSSLTQPFSHLRGG